MNTYQHLVGDFNAKNPVWGGKKLDDRGETLGDYILENDLNPINDPESLPSFTSSNGKSWIDITLATNNLIGKIKSWEVLDEISASDHNYIRIDLSNKIENKCIKLTKKGELKLIEEIIDDDWIKLTKTEKIHSRTNLEHIINTIIKKLEDLYKKYVKTVVETTKQNP